GGQWRAPFSRSALAEVKRKLRGHTRRRTLRDGSLAIREEKARRWVVSYVLYQAAQRNTLGRERDIIEFSQSFTFSDASEVAPPGISPTDEKWRACLRLYDDLLFKRAALFAAYAHAIGESLASDTREEIRQRHAEGQVRPFGYSTIGEVR